MKDLSIEIAGSVYQADNKWQPEWHNGEPEYAIANSKPVESCLLSKGSLEEKTRIQWGNANEAEIKTVVDRL